MDRTGAEGTHLEIDFQYFGTQTVTVELAATMGIANEPADLVLRDGGNGSYDSMTRTLTIDGNRTFPGVTTETV